MHEILFWQHTCTRENSNAEISPMHWPAAVKWTDTLMPSLIYTLPKGSAAHHCVYVWVISHFGRMVGVARMQCEAQIDFHAVSCFVSSKFKRQCTPEDERMTPNCSLFPFVFCTKTKWAEMTFSQEHCNTADIDHFTQCLCEKYALTQ